MREVAEACHTVPSAVHSHLTRLERDNLIHLNDKRSRAIEIVGGAWQPPDDFKDRETSEPDHSDDEDEEDRHHPIRRTR